MATEIRDNEVLDRLNNYRHVILTEYTAVVEGAESARREWADFLVENSDAISELKSIESVENGE